MKKLFFNFRYFRKNAPWDSGISPPELLDFIEKYPPGRAIDLGCGTGTNVITLAQHGWQVSGVDFASRAIKIARQKAKTAKLDAKLQVDDVTKLRGIDGSFDLALDMGCFHNLGDKKVDYINRLEEILAPNGFWLLYAHIFSPEHPNPGHEITSAEFKELENRFALIWRKDGTDKIGRNSAWALFQKTSQA